MLKSAGSAGKSPQASSVMVFITLASIMVMLLSCWLFWKSAQRAFSYATMTNQNLVNVIDRHASRVFDEVDVVITMVRHNLSIGSTHAALRDLLVELGPSVPHLQSLTVSDPATGRVKFGASINPAEVTDLPTGFGASSASHNGLTIGEAVLSPTTRSWYLPVGRTMRLDNGTLVQIVVLVSMKHLQDGYATLAIGSNGSIALVRSDSKVLLRRPYMEELVNRSIGKSELFTQHLPSSNQGDYRDVSVIDGVERLFSYRKLEGAPLVAVASLSKDDILGTWFRESLYDAVPSVICLIMLVLLGIKTARTTRERNESVLHLHATLNHLDQGMLIFGPDQRVQFYNARILEILELPQTFLDQRPNNEQLLALFETRASSQPPADAGLQEIRRNWLAAAPSFIWLQRPGRFLEVRTAQLPDGGFVRTFADVSEREETQRRLRSSEMLYRQLADSLPQKIWITGADGSALYCNREMFEYHGPVGSSAAERAELYHPEDAPRLVAARDAALASGSTLKIEARIRRWDGAWRWHQIMKTPVRHDENGRVVQWLGTSLDIHDIYTGLQKIKVTSSLLTLAQQAAGAGVWHWNAKSETIVHSPESARLHGWSCADGEFIEVLSEHWSQCIHPDDVDAVWAQTRAALETGSDYDVEFRLAAPDKNGEHRWLFGCGRAVLDEQNRPTGIIGLNFDITERKRNAEQMTQARDAAERASRAKSQFVATMSHEIRTPLNAILGLASLALDSGEASATLRRQIELIEKAGSALLTIVNDVLDLSKIEAGKLDIEPRRVSLETLAEDCMALTRGLTDRQGIALSITIAPDFPEWVFVDETRVRQILLNLLTNATKFTPSGSITVALACDASNVMLSVIDTGIGIAADQIPHLFQDFRQSDDMISRHYGGSGLGLAISRRLAEMMGGTLTVESTIGKGSTFRLSLPLVEVDSDWMPMSAQANEAETIIPRHVLLVDDVDINLEIVAQMLTSAGHTVEMASSGPAAIDAFSRSRHDIILLDVQMPIMDGLETCRHIRAGSPEGATVPIIALSANVFAEQVSKCDAAGMSAHLGKPFKRRVLLDMVARWTSSTAAAVESEIQGPEEAALFDDQTFADLQRLLGRAKSAELLARFRDELTTRLSDPNPDVFKNETHILISSAGLLGCQKLSALARHVEQVMGAQDDYSAAKAAMLACRAATLEAVKKKLHEISQETYLTLRHGGLIALS